MESDSQFSNATAPLSPIIVEGLRRVVRGDLILPEMEGYAATRTVWNNRIDRRPALIVQCAGVGDVRESIRFAQAQGIPVAVRGGGHSYAGHSTGDGCLVLDLARLKRIHVDPQRQTVRAEPGVLWRELDHETHAFGLAVTGSQVSRVGIAGLTLGGGLGWLMRKWGLTCDNLLSAELVSADGSLQVANAGENPELFWALRGGGGNFGAVTRFEYQLQKVDVVYAGVISFPLHMAKPVIQHYREFAGQAPDEFSSTIAFATIPNGPPVINIAACYLGDPAAGAALVQPLRKFGPTLRDQFAPIAYPALQSINDQAIPPGSRVAVRSNFLDDLDEGLVETLAEHYARTPSPLSSVVILQMGGEVGRVASQATAFYHRRAAYSLNLFCAWASPAEDDRNTGWLHALWEVIQPYLGQGVYVNVLDDEGPGRVQAAYGENYARLAALKRRCDPHNLFRFNQNIQAL